MASPLQGLVSTQNNPLYLDPGQSTTTNMYYIPDTLENWKWPRCLNPHHVEVKAAFTEWVKRFEALGNKVQNARDQADLRTS